MSDYYGYRVGNGVDPPWYKEPTPSLRIHLALCTIPMCAVCAFLNDRARFLEVLREDDA